ncbi:DUF5696 domain-containing protein [Paenibacillus hamazuiensis]|uniref:DUF5696 domain-containing protein n=1 Tax=Paenibacillus hamazuiensis TaxID=2936508 RepID=UPI00200EA79B|nr:DUF5696 domain-containing protein [Paenibacillus hamazuiensis]
MRRSRIIFSSAVGLVIVAAAVLLYMRLAEGTRTGTAASKATSAAAGASQPASAVGAPKPALPDEASFRPAAESAGLKLWVDDKTGHFKVEQKKTGHVWRSYPDPDQWSRETITGTWRNNLMSPVMLEYIDASNSKSQAKTISWLEDKGVLEKFQTTPDGFKMTYNFTGTGFKIPVEVRLREDYVETAINDRDIREGKLSLLHVKLFPLFGAEPYKENEEGYTLLPDGAGALIRFKPNQANDKSVYRENVYGNDSAFYSERTGRSAIRLPVFGIKSGPQAFVAVMVSGEEYAKLFAAPAGAYGQYNWATPEWTYRLKYFQSTSKKGPNGFFTYNKERFNTPERATRYYLLEPDQSDYVGMAGKYRQFLIAEKGLKPLQPKNGEVPFYADIVGADIKQGLVWDKYLPGTTTSEAAAIVGALLDQGIRNLTVRYAGWQSGGYSSFGGLFPVDSRLGGNDGMRQFIRFAHSRNVPVYLTANYTLNNTGRDGFWPTFDGMRDLSGTVVEFENPANREMTTMVSPRLAEKTVAKDLSEFKALGADGIYFNEGVGQFLNSDFNERYKANRSEVLQSQRSVLKTVRDALGGVMAEDANAYTWDQTGHIHRLADSYSHDIFVDEPVPFLPIVLHGLLTYSTEWSNLREQNRAGFLRSIELGAYPAYVLTNAPSGSMKGAFSIWYYSMDYRDWLSQAAAEYKRFNEALGDVQDRAIVGHRTLAPGVKETEYAGGKKIVVNYNAEPFVHGDVRVPAQDFIVLKGGSAP